MFIKGLAILFFIFFIHLIGIALFTRGFLSTRLSLSEFTNCSNPPCTLPPTYTRAVVLIIDALRFDFLSPHPPHPNSPFHHNVLVLPREMTARHPRHSLLFNAYADPPTTTLQRIKGLTTGSLSSFVEIGSNFGGYTVEEDSILHQLRANGKKIAFIGDDTWMTAFPDSFEPNMTFPYDSFNVEDLHSVDEGVIRHLFPLLTDKSKPFDFLIGHFLGVDHVGHRLGPDHPAMKAKLAQMDEVLTRVVDLIDGDTLLVVLGDHGMDRTGDHGGDGHLETSSGLWIYSKERPIAQDPSSIPLSLLRESVFPGAVIPHRNVQQVDLVPTISLLLSLPVPFNNLGTVIPEIFWRDRDGTMLTQALDITSTQINKYLDSYRRSASGGDLESAWSELHTLWSAASSSKIGDEKMIALDRYNRFALATCRSLWAQFNPVLMGFGLILLGVGLITGLVLYRRLSEDKTNMVHWSSIPIPVPLVLHTLTFMSNSFTVWEDRIITFLLLTSIVPFAVAGFSAPTARLRGRILGFSVLFAMCIRLIAISTVCREEQQPYCDITFFASLSHPSPPIYVVVLAIPTSIALPLVMQLFLGISKSDRGVAKAFFPWILRPTLLAGSLFWIMEWADSAEVLGPHWTDTLRIARSMMARLAFGLVVVGGTSLWWAAPTCMEIHVATSANGKELTVLGFANAFGSPYLIFWSIFFAIVYVTTQLTGQLVLGLGVVALLAYLEVVDSVRDAKGLGVTLASSKAPGSVALDTPTTSLVSSGAVPSLRFAEIVPLVLLGLHLFYGTGHQSVVSSIQWKSAFLLTSTVKYPYSAITVVINSLGSQFLFALAVPLLALWYRAPVVGRSSGGDDGTNALMRKESLLSGLGMMMYHSSLLFGSAASVTVLRRHLMVWKIFAPRFMSAVLGLLVVDLGVLIGVGIGVGRIQKVMETMFGGGMRKS